jgi:hypothetical protein
VIIILGINRLGVFGGGIQTTEMKMNRKFNTFTDLKSLELEVPKDLSRYRVRLGTQG